MTLFLHRGCIVALGLFMGITLAHGQEATTRPSDPAANYHRVLEVLKSPPTTGVLIAELAPLSAAQRANLQPGDILTRYHGKPVETPEDLTDLVGRVLNEAERLKPVPVEVRRGSKTIQATVACGPLGITPVAVESGVAGALNPPPTPRGELALEWDQVPALDENTHPKAAQEPPGVLWTRLFTRTGTGEGKLCAIERTQLRRGKNHWELGIESQVIQDGLVVEEQASLLTFAIGDQVRTPGFELERMELANPRTHLEAERKGLLLRGVLGMGDKTSATPDNTEAFAQPLVAPGGEDGALCVPSFALPTLGAALPQREGLVLAVGVISEIDLQTRLGYVLETRGRQTLEIDGRKVEAWCVCLRLWGQSRMTFWYNDHRELLEAHLGGGLIAQRAADEAHAKGDVDTTKPKKGSR